MLYAGAIARPRGRRGARGRRGRRRRAVGPSRSSPPADAAERLAAWARGQAAPVVVVDSVLDGLEVATALTEAGLAVAGTKSLREAAARAELRRDRRRRATC